MLEARHIGRLRLAPLQRVAALVFEAQDPRVADEIEVAFRGALAH